MPTPSRAVLLVSKPLAPPWNDGSKNLAREIARGVADLSAAEVHAFVPRGIAAPAGVSSVEVPDATLTRRTSLALLSALATHRASRLWHLVFAPSARTAGLVRPLAALRRRRTVQTLASAPALEVRLGEVGFADRIVALSRATAARALAEGVAAERLRVVPIAITPPRAPSAEDVDALRVTYDLGARFVVTFAGDLEHGRGADVLLDACAATKARGDLLLVLACRDKTSRARSRREQLARRASRAGVAVRMLGEIPSIHALLAASDVVALPTDTLYAKVDHPLVLLEAMHLGRPVLVSEGTSAHELAEEGGALGAALDPHALAAALDALVADEALRARWSASALAHARARSVEAMARAYAAIYDELLA